MNPSPDYGRPPTLRVHWSWDYPRLPRDTVIASIGSCFSEELVGELLACGFSGAQNPNGILYNPVSIADAMDHVVQGENYTGENFSSSTACTTHGFIMVLFPLSTLIAPWMPATVLWRISGGRLQRLEFWL